MSQDNTIGSVHFLAALGAAILFSVPFDFVIVSAYVTADRLEAVSRSADIDGHERHTVTAELHTEAGATAMSGTSLPASRTLLHATERRVPLGVTAGETARSARSSSASDLLGRVSRASMANAQGIGPVRDQERRARRRDGRGRFNPMVGPDLSDRASGIYEVTAYSHGCTLPRSGREPHPQRAANGRWPVADVTVAADPSHPFGSEVLIEGLGFRTVGDRGHAIKGRRLDLFVDSCREARAFGRRFLRVFAVPAATTREARGFDVETR